MFLILVMQSLLISCKRDNMEKEHQTKTLTFRIAKRHEKVLREEAKRKNVSLNTFVNQLLSEYLDRDLYLKKFGMIIELKAIFKGFLGALSEQACIDLGTKQGREAAPEYVLFRYGELSLEKYLTSMYPFLEIGLGAEYTKDTGENEIRINIRHEFGKKGSLWLTALLASALEIMADRKLQYTINENVVALVIKI
jgi:hypothetical protein